MSGCGRKHRAKHLVTQYLDDAWEGPEKEGDLLAVCIASPAAKHVHVVIVEPPASASAASTTVSTTATPALNEKQKEDEESDVNDEENRPKEQNSAVVSSETVSSEREPERFVANLPGKFNKVLWLGCGDLIVLRLGTVHYKPSPQQLKYFYGTPAGAAWEPSIQRAEKAAISLFKKVQSQTVTTVANQNLSGTGKFAVRANPQGGSSEPVTSATGKSSASAASAVGPSEQVTKTSKYFAAANNNVSRNVVEDDPLAGMMGDGSEDDLEDFVNPNRQSIKHRRQAFFPDEDLEEEEEEESEECEEDDE